MKAEFRSQNPEFRIKKQVRTRCVTLFSPGRGGIIVAHGASRGLQGTILAKPQRGDITSTLPTDDGCACRPLRGLLLPGWMVPNAVGY